MLRRTFCSALLGAVVALRHALPHVVSPAYAAEPARDPLQDGSESTHRRTGDVVEAAYYGELTAHLHYISFARVARLEGYPNIAYLFSALSVSELIHAERFREVLVGLERSPEKTRELVLRVASTRENLETAAHREIEKIDLIYPQFVKRLGAGNHAEALLYSGYAWESHKQHRDQIAEIRRWVGTFFDAVARRIEDRDDRYFICVECGSTVNELPEEDCPICRQSADKYREVNREG